MTVLRAPELSRAELAAVRAARLGGLLRRCGDELEVGARSSLALRLTRDGELASLNRRFRGIDSATDVIAFPGGERHHVGDVAISVERALLQAVDGVAELRLLAVHGLLHCLGHDHAGRGEARAMTAATCRLLPGQLVPDLVVEV